MCTQHTEERYAYGEKIMPSGNLQAFQNELSKQFMSMVVFKKDKIRIRASKENHKE